MTHLHATKDYLTSEGETYFSKFQNMKIFKLLTGNRNVDNILKNVSFCKNLIHLEVYENVISYEGLTNIVINLPNLKLLNILSPLQIKKSEFFNIIVNFKNLETTSFKFFKELDYDFFEILSNTKIELKIF